MSKFPLVFLAKTDGTYMKSCILSSWEKGIPLKAKPCRSNCCKALERLGNFFCDFGHILKVS